MNPLAENEVVFLIEKLKLSSSPSPDELSASIIKNCHIRDGDNIEQTLIKTGFEESRVYLTSGKKWLAMQIEVFHWLQEVFILFSSAFGYPRMK
ncbi:hypothetical protein HHI36_015600 [Cryptolaemus montrouzieri]|uniref:Uncharacterized protein n=1 Tax=Cryptolaemus montrouzieri TaxID=559131 RepID=A0ABD2N640_9CUCU